ncbi:MAG: hypothetical protein AAB599_02160 [Patescibacteria group bacterium]
MAQGHTHISGVARVQAAAATLLARKGGHELAYVCDECGRLARQEATALETKLGLRELEERVQIALLEGLKQGDRVASVVGIANQTTDTRPLKTATCKVEVSARSLVRQNFHPWYSLRD